MKDFRCFKFPYVLIEEERGKYQPMFKEYPADLPTINYSSPPLCCPFSSHRNYSSKIKGKCYQKPKPGCCEICYTRYEDYNEHVATREHVEFAKNPNNYRKVDEIIEELNSVRNTFIPEVPPSPCDKLEEDLYIQTRKFTEGYGMEEESVIRLSCESEENIDMENSECSLDIILTFINEKRQKY